MSKKFRQPVTNEKKGKSRGEEQGGQGMYHGKDHGNHDDGLHLEQALSKARWFTRGWTLQELIAPPEVEFCNKYWKTISKRNLLYKTLSRITSIHESVLINPGLLPDFSVAQKFSWAADRESPKLEDVAYCLSDIFGINMPLLYGEGKASFIRLQEEIIKNSEDQSIFAWDYPGQLQISKLDGGFLADHPAAFKVASDVVPSSSDASFYDMSNRGLRIHAPISQRCYEIKSLFEYGFVLTLFCHTKDKDYTLAIVLEQVPGLENKFYRRSKDARIYILKDSVTSMSWRTIYIHRSGNLTIKRPTKAIFLRSYPSELLTMIEGGYDGSLLSLTQFRLESSKKWIPLQQKATFQDGTGLCIAVLMFDLGLSQNRYIILVAFSVEEKFTEIYQRHISTYQETGEVIKNICARVEESNVEPITLPSGKYKLGVTSTRQAIFDELICVVDIKLEPLS